MVVSAGVNPTSLKVCFGLSMVEKPSPREVPTPVVGLPAGCRSRQRQVLEWVDAEGSVDLDELRLFVAGTRCIQGHEINRASLQNGLLSVGTDRRVSLGRAGSHWLDEQAVPASDWDSARAADSPELRAWQREALGAWVDHGRQGVVQAVTGTGKSRIGVEAIREALQHDYSIVVVVPTVDLVEQWTRALA